MYGALTANILLLWLMREFVFGWLNPIERRFVGFRSRTVWKFQSGAALWILCMDVFVSRRSYEVCVWPSEPVLYFNAYNWTWNIPLWSICGGHGRDNEWCYLPVGLEINRFQCIFTRLWTIVWYWLHVMKNFRLRFTYSIISLMTLCHHLVSV